MEFLGLKEDIPALKKEWDRKVKSELRKNRPPIDEAVRQENTIHRKIMQVGKAAEMPDVLVKMMGREAYLKHLAGNVGPLIPSVPQGRVRKIVDALNEKYPGIEADLAEYAHMPANTAIMSRRDMPGGREELSMEKLIAELTPEMSLTRKEITRGSQPIETF
jgi:hypothetical protein